MNRIILYAIASSAFLISAIGCAWPWQIGVVDRQYQQEIVDLKAHQSRMMDEQVRLNAELRDLKRLNVKYKNLIELQDRVLQLLDDRKNTVKTMIYEEAKKQNLIFQYSDIQQSHISIAEHDLFHASDINLSIHGREKLMKLCKEFEQEDVRTVVVENNYDLFSSKMEPKTIQVADYSLSIIRAATVAKYLSQKLELPAGRTIYYSYIKHDPELAAANKPAALLERRIDIVFEHAK